MEILVNHCCVKHSLSPGICQGCFLGKTIQVKYNGSSKILVTLRSFSTKIQHSKISPVFLVADNGPSHKFT